MLLNLRELYGKQHNVYLSEQIDISAAVKGYSSIHNAGEIKTEAEAVYEAGNIRVTGRVDGGLELVCSRCLTAFYEPLQFSYVELFSNDAPEEETELTGREEAVNYVTGDKIDLVPYVEEHILLELPMFPLCDHKCKGLCPACGLNLNVETCKCMNERMDPRWSGLKDLLSP